MRYALRDARLHGDQAVLHLVVSRDEADAGEAFFVLTLDDDGMITALAQYTSRATVEGDLAIRAGGARALSRGPAPAVQRLVPFVHVADMARSVAFYGHLGFAAVDAYEPRAGSSGPAWSASARRSCSRRRPRRSAPARQAVLFHLYAHDLPGLRDRLVAAGLTPGEIVDGTPGPRQEMRLSDPDGYVLMIAQIEADN